MSSCLQRCECGASWCRDSRRLPVWWWRQVVQSTPRFCTWFSNFWLTLEEDGPENGDATSGDFAVVGPCRRSSCFARVLPAELFLPVINGGSTAPRGSRPRPLFIVRNIADSPSLTPRADSWPKRRHMKFMPQKSAKWKWSELPSGPGGSAHPDHHPNKTDAQRPKNALKTVGGIA